MLHGWSFCSRETTSPELILNPRFPDKKALYTLYSLKAGLRMVPGVGFIRSSSDRWKCASGGGGGGGKQFKGIPSSPCYLH